MSALFIILVGLMMTLFGEEMLISHKCIHGLMPNIIKKSWTVSILQYYTIYIYINRGTLQLTTSFLKNCLLTLIATGCMYRVRVKRINHIASYCKWQAVLFVKNDQTFLRQIMDFLIYENVLIMHLLLQLLNLILVLRNEFGLL